MSLIRAAGIATALLAGIGHGAPSINEQLWSRASTCNTATDRACWTSDFDINTDYETSTPTGVTRTFNWTLEEFENWQAPDGSIKDVAMLINGEFPGPTITADWGDQIEVTLTNNLANNGTSFHWHGLRMLNTNLQDGVNGVTECPLAPGQSKTYTFTLTQYGTTWYHSHYGSQAANGPFGAIVINGPASANYDIDLGAYPIGDFYTASADEIVESTLSSPAPPSSQNVLFNGTNIAVDGSGGAYSTIDLTPGSTHLLRLYNPSAEHNYQVSIVGHNMTVIGTDLVAVEPITVDNIFLGIGQRANVLIDATATPGNDQGTTPDNPGCVDSLKYTPIVSRTADTFVQTSSNTLDVTDVTSPTVQWLVNSSAIDANWENPIVSHVLAGSLTFATTDNLIQIDAADVWTYWIIENDSAVPHPMHLHGHDFLILGTSTSGAGSFTSDDAASLNMDNPTRRDVTMLPALGWTVLAFKSDNPGAWLFHCHISWHISGGLGLQFLERPDDMNSVITTAEQTALEDQCAAWSDFWDGNANVEKIDSGLKMRTVRALSH